MMFSFSFFSQFYIFEITAKSIDPLRIPAELVHVIKNSFSTETEQKNVDLFVYLFNIQ